MGEEVGVGLYRESGLVLTKAVIERCHETKKGAKKQFRSSFVVSYLFGWKVAKRSCKRGVGRGRLEMAGEDR